MIKVELARNDNRLQVVIDACVLMLGEVELSAQLFIFLSIKEQLIFQCFTLDLLPWNLLFQFVPQTFALRLLIWNQQLQWPNSIAVLGGAFVGLLHSCKLKAFINNGRAWRGLGWWRFVEHISTGQTLVRCVTTLCAYSIGVTEQLATTLFVTLETYSWNGFQLWQEAVATV